MAGAAAPDDRQGQTASVRAALSGLCPQCGARTLFSAPAQVAGECRACGLELAALERGGRLAGLITIAIAALLITAALALDEWLRPPIIVHALLWLPLTIGAVLGALRVFKGLSVYRSFAGTGNQDL